MTLAAEPLSVEWIADEFAESDVLAEAIARPDPAGDRQAVAEPGDMAELEPTAPPIDGAE